MLKKILPNIAYLALMLCLGLGIFYYFLNPANINNGKNTHLAKLNSAAFFSAKMPNENGVNQALIKYKGKIIVLNFWATWCPPCREEIPELSQLQVKYLQKNVTVVGIAVDEIDSVKEFVKATPINYPIVVDENSGMALGIKLGNDKGVLPYTVIIDSSGKVIQSFFGRINKPILEHTLLPLLPQ